ncbi:hypothetical protein CLOSTHATH_00580 [Hungatella hathewayi DSM 13479]|uniref:Uncharacterized protein n=1 Tax=Hungatella hathewayi DSM 13479 TaxID=566550 RepID=D3AAF9_9FIRM|nr:hypothetical protein CLOSTHATH_00580 [Hungatella hathewayi DSM 13479]
MEQIKVEKKGQSAGIPSDWSASWTVCAAGHHIDAGKCHL